MEFHALLLNDVLESDHQSIQILAGLGGINTLRLTLFILIQVQIYGLFPGKNCVGVLEIRYTVISKVHK